MLVLLFAKLSFYIKQEIFEKKSFLNYNLLSVISYLVLIFLLSVISSFLFLLSIICYLLSLLMSLSRQKNLCYNNVLTHNSLGGFIMSSEEKLLLSHAINGDVESFEKLIESYQLKAYNIAFRMLGNEEDAKDAIQDSFIKIYHSLHNFRGDSSFYTWVYRIVSNTCYDFLKKKNRLNNNIMSLTSYNNSLEGEIGDIKDELHQPDILLDNKENEATMVQCIHKLSYDHKSVIILRDIQGFSYEEIAQILNCSEGTVKSRISRARNKLKEIVLSNMEQIK